MAKRSRPPIVRALQQLYAAAQVETLRDRDWHSMTFSGRQLVLRIDLAGSDAMRRAEKLSAELPEIEFALARGFVAEIAVMKCEPTNRGAMLEIETLILDS